MLKPADPPEPAGTFETVAELAPHAIQELSCRGITLTPEREHDAAGPTSWAYVDSDGDSVLLVHHPEAPVPGLEVRLRAPDLRVLQRPVANLGHGPELVTWTSQSIG